MTSVINANDQDSGNDNNKYDRELCKKDSPGDNYIPLLESFRLISLSLSHLFNCSIKTQKIDFLPFDFYTESISSNFFHFPIMKKNQFSQN